MSATGSAVPGFIDALVATFTAAGLTTFDGPGITDDPVPVAVYVGLGDPDSDQIAEAASANQVWAWLGHSQRDEPITVHCRIVCWSGDSDPAAMKRERDAAFATFETIGAAMQADPTLGAPFVLNVTDVGGIRLYQVQDPESGTRADIAFDVTCKARLS